MLYDNDRCLVAKNLPDVTRKRTKLFSGFLSHYLTLRDSGVRFLAVDMPEANDLTVGVMALAMAKARGVKLGNPNGADSLRRAGKDGEALRAAVATKPDRFAADLTAVIRDIQVDVHTSLRASALELDVCGMLTRQGGAWQVSNVRNLLVWLV